PHEDFGESSPWACRRVQAFPDQNQPGEKPGNPSSSTSRAAIRPMPAPISTSERKCAVRSARATARIAATANQTGHIIGQTQVKITATQQMVRAWPEGKEL